MARRKVWKGKRFGRKGGLTVYQMYSKPNYPLLNKLGIDVVQVNLPAGTKLKFNSFRKWKWNMVKIRQAFTERQGFRKRRPNTMLRLANMKTTKDKVEGKNLELLAEQMDAVAETYNSLALDFIKAGNKLKAEAPPDYQQTNIVVMRLIDKIFLNVEKLLNVQSKMINAKNKLIEMLQTHRLNVLRIIDKYQIHRKCNEDLASATESLPLSFILPLSQKSTSLASQPCRLKRKGVKKSAGQPPKKKVFSSFLPPVPTFPWEELEDEGLTELVMNEGEVNK